MLTPAEKTLLKLLSCYYDKEEKKSSTVPYVGTLKDEEIKSLWIKAANHLAVLK